MVVKIALSQPDTALTKASSSGFSWIRKMFPPLAPGDVSALIVVYIILAILAVAVVGVVWLNPDVGGNILSLS